VITKYFVLVWNGLMDIGIRLTQKGIDFCDRKIAEAEKSEL
jgi:hypothetical protein